MPDTTAHLYTVEELREAIRRLVRLGMTEERATMIVAAAFPELKAELLQ